MNKQEFLSELREGLSGLPEDELRGYLTFYSEMIDDRIEDGASEEEAVGGIGSVSELISQIKAESRRPVGEKKKRAAWETVLLVLGSPIWLSLLIAAFAVTVSLCAALWAVITVLWAVFASFTACGLAGIAAGVYFAAGGSTLTGIAVIGAGLVCAGLSIFAFFGCRAATRGSAVLTGKSAAWIKNRIIKKEEA